MSALQSPVRHPDLGDTRLMGRRAWALVLLNILIPGSPQLIAGARRLGRFGVSATFLSWAIAIAGGLGFTFARASFITLATNPIVLWALQALIVAYVLLWVVLTIDTLRLVRLVRVGRGMRPLVAGIAVIALAATGATGAYAVMAANVTRDTVGTVFAGATIEPPVDGRYNILLLGGDAGPDREGLRPDSISVVSIEAATGKATIIGIPRNMQAAPFSAGSPMAAIYPTGYGADGCDVDVCLINSIYTEVELYHGDLYPDAKAAGSSPGIEAMRDAAEGVLGLKIQYYALIDMQGFAQLIDALGGVTIDSPARYPITDEVDENGQPYEEVPYIEAGVQKMDGVTALWYSRLRAGTTDYDRMQRQRQVQEALLEQFDPANVLTKFQAVAQAGAQVVSTDVPQSMLGYFVDLAGKSRSIPVATVELVPPLVDPDFPDYETIRATVAAALTIATPGPTGSSG